MTKKEFVDLYFAEGDFTTKAEAERKAVSFVNTIEKALSRGDEVSFLGFGKFKVIERAARTCRNPQTGEEMKVAAKKAVKFTAGKDLGLLVNKK
ncbi:MAG: HU family DNA-binding protein [Fusobacteriaceae bacterium]|jgi:DNA-binding protein HU-beta|nr:HU family DNA-binding protein [Fusobacteriaceae bacterium]